MDPRGTNLGAAGLLVEDAGEYAKGSNAGGAVLAAAGEELVKAGNADDIGGCVVPDVEEAKEAKGSTRFACPVCGETRQHQDPDGKRLMGYPIRVASTCSGQTPVIHLVVISKVLGSEQILHQTGRFFTEGNSPKRSPAVSTIGFAHLSQH